MFKKILKWLGIGLGIVILLLVLAIAGMMISTDMRLNKTYTLADENLKTPSDPVVLARGKRWAQAYCGDCHGDNLAGVKNWLNIPNLMSVDSANLTSGKGGIGGTFKDADWVRAVRHGVGPDGKPILMPASIEFSHLSDEDLAAIIAYVKTVPPVDNVTSHLTVSPMAKILIALGAFGNLPAEDIKHDARPAAAPPAGATTQYGDYIVKTGGCRSCHGEQLAGGKNPDPEGPPGPNLTQGGPLRDWSDADFIKTMRTGTKPTGIKLNDSMPWKGVGKLNDDELKAIWAYLKSLPALPNAIK